MLSKARDQGARDALARLKLAEGFLGGVARNMIGSPGRAFVEGGKAFSPGGFLSARNVFWPAVSGPGGSKLNWLARAGTLAMPLSMMSTMKQHPEEGRLSNALGALGGAAGMAYGFPAAGVLGAPLLGGAGAALGRGVGHLLGSHPKDQLL
jgi:hypothetical protein